MYNNIIYIYNVVGRDLRGMRMLSSRSTESGYRRWQCPETQNIYIRICIVINLEVIYRYLLFYILFAFHFRPYKLLCPKNSADDNAGERAYIIKYKSKVYMRVCIYVRARIKKNRYDETPILMPHWNEYTCKNKNIIHEILYY